MKVSKLNIIHLDNQKILPRPTNYPDKYSSEIREYTLKGVPLKKKQKKPRPVCSNVKKANDQSEKVVCR